MSIPIIFGAAFLGIATLGLLLRFFLSRKGRLLAPTSIIPVVGLFVCAVFLAAAAVIDRTMGSGDFTVFNAVSAALAAILAVLLLRKRARANALIQGERK